MILNKHELLSPAGDMECLRQAVFNGADAIYIAGKNFGARKFATNFSNEEIVEAIRFCHLYGVKVYVTMNTLVKNTEVEDFLKQAYFLHKNGVDALIVQDFGMICLLREKYPNLEIHASTQNNTASKKTCQLLYDLGVKRVVFPRELSIDEIDSIDVPIEKEAFIHGALCISYSGCCLMSSMLGGRSGNRGECAGSCRLPFYLEKDGKKIEEKKYLLSTKELNSSSCFERLLESSVYSFKIEGRMKSPLYVGFITKMYRDLIDGVKFNLKEATDNLRTIFNREFTKGRLFFENDKDLMNIESPNHRGLPIGRVVSVLKDKIKIKLDSDKILNQYDAIRFLGSKEGLIVNFLYDEDLKLTSSAKGVCYINKKFDLKKDDVVTKTQDFLLGKEFEKNSKKKIEVNFLVVAKQEKLLRVEISDGINKCIVEKDCIEKAVKAPITKEDIIRQLSKLGGSPFIVKDFNIEMDNGIFIQMRLLNEVRRYLVNELIEKRVNKKIEVVERKVLFDREDIASTDLSEKVGISCLVYNMEQLKTCLELNVDRIYVNDTKLYEKYKDYENVYLVIDRCAFDIENKLVLRNFISEIFRFNNLDVFANYSLNVTNIYTAYYLKKIGLNCIPLSVELTKEEIDNFITLYNQKFGYIKFELLSYGRVWNMVIKGNILGIKEKCFGYNLVGLNNKKFPVYYDGVNTHVFNFMKRNFEKFNDKIDIRLDFYDESSNEIKNIVNNYQ